MAPARLSKVVYASAGACALAGMVLWWTSDGARAAREREAYQARVESQSPSQSAPAGPIEVDVLLVTPRSFALRTDLSAVLQPLRRVEVGAEVQGRILEVPAREYSRVEANAVLVQLDRERFQAALERASAVQARARANYKLAQLDLERQRGLRDQNVASEAEFDRATSSERARRADLKEARAALSDAELDLARTAIRAPFKGTVSRLKLEPGAYLRPGDFVAEVVDLSEIELEVGVTDRQVVALREGALAELSVDVFPGERFAGTIAHVSRSADRETQQFPIEVHVPNPDGRLLSGMLGTVHFSGKAQTPEIRLPRSAVRRDYELDFVFVVDRGPGEERARLRRVVTKAVAFEPDTVGIASGLQPGERVVVGNRGELKDGTAVRSREVRP